MSGHVSNIKTVALRAILGSNSSLKKIDNLKTKKTKFPLRKYSIRFIILRLRLRSKRWHTIIIIILLSYLLATHYSEIYTWEIYMEQIRPYFPIRIIMVNRVS